jgi:hypothetical protein
MLFIPLRIYGVYFFLVAPEMPGTPIIRDSTVSQFEIAPLITPKGGRDASRWERLDHCWFNVHHNKLHLNYYQLFVLLRYFF